jgi:putative ABC transport system permease protein
MQAVAWRNLKRRRLRTFFTAAAIALGVANVFGVFVTNDSMRDSVERNARSATGGADVIARLNSGPWFRDEDVERLERLPDVRTFHRWGTYKELATDGATKVYLQAGDLHAARELISVRTGRLPRPGAAEIVLSVTASRVLGAGIGDHVVEADPRDEDGARPPGSRRRTFDPDAPQDPYLIVKRVGPRPLRFAVTGIVDDYPSVNAEQNYGSLTSNEYMWKVEEPDRIVEMTFMLDEGVDPETWVQSASITLPHVSFRSITGDPLFRDFLASFRALLTGTSALALFIGAFLVYLIFTLALAERTRQIGLLHAVGASGRQVAGAILREALLLGVTATAAGIALGLLLAVGLLRLVSAIGNLGIEAPVRLSIAPFIAALLVGIIATVVGAAVPAVRAARMTPVEAVTGRTDVQRRPRAWVAGVPLFAGGVLVITLRGLSSDPVSQLAITAVLLGAVFMVPLGIFGLARTARRAISGAVPGSGVIVFRHLTREPGRSAYTLSLVMLVLAAVIALMTSTRSLQASNDRIIDARFGADLILYGRHVGETAREIDRLDGVAGATSISYGRTIGVVSGGRETANLVLIEPDEFFAIAGFPWNEGNDTEARAALVARTGVLLPSRLASRHELRLGRTVRVQTDAGTHAYRIAGTYGGGTGPEIGVVGSVHDERLRTDEDVQSAVYMNFEADVARGDMLDRVAAVLREHGGLSKELSWERQEQNSYGLEFGPYFAISGAEIKDQARRELDSYVRLFSAVIGVIVIAGALGMATALATTVVLRTRELGTVEAIGATRSQIRRMVVAESILLSATAYFLAIGLGAVIAWLFIGGITELTGSSIEIQFAWGALPVVAVLALAIAIAASIVPARRALRLTPVEALRYE